MKKINSGYLYIVVCALIFSLVEIALKSLGGAFHPMQITCIRFIMGAAVLLPFALRALRARGAQLTARDFVFFALMGFLFVDISMTLYQMAVTQTKASVVAILFSCNPIFVTVLAHPILGEPIRKNHVVALCLEVLAAFIIIDPFHASLSTLGCALALSSAVFFALYSTLSKKRRIPRLGGITVTCFCSLLGGAELLLLLLLGRTAAGAALFGALGLDLFVDVPILAGISVPALPALLYIGAVNTGFGFVCHALAMEKTSAQTASLIFLLKPMLAPLFALLLLREEITPNMWIGIVCFLIGSSVAILPGLLAERRARAETR